MTYCVGLRLNHGLVFMSDTRTNAGVDNISTFRKMTTWEKPGERVVTVMTAGNLATTQAVISLLDERMKAPSERSSTIFEAPSMFQVARLVGQTLREVIAANMDTGMRGDTTFNATIMLGGQIKGSEPRLFLIYPEGNFIEITEDSPFFQIGEHKYGKPILDRVANQQMRLGEAAKLVLLSFDSTLRSNLSVGMPIDMVVYNTDNLSIDRVRRIEQDDPYFRSISQKWSEALRAAVEKIEEFDI